MNHPVIVPNETHAYMLVLKNLISKLAKQNDAHWAHSSNSKRDKKRVIEKRQKAPMWKNPEPKAF